MIERKLPIKYKTRRKASESEENKPNGAKRRSKDFRKMDTAFNLGLKLDDRSCFAGRNLGKKHLG